jgi:parallel beta-helix repeat protein
MRVWKRADNSTHTGAFQAGQAYKAELTLTAKPTYTFNGVSGFSYTGIPASDISHSISADYKTAVVTINFPATAGVTVSGTITSGDFPGGLNGATVQLQNGGVDYLAPVTTAYDGTYTISGVPAGTYTVVVSKAGYSSYTSPSSFTVNTGNITMSVVTLNLQVTAPARDLTTLIDSPVPAVSPDTIPDVSFAGGQYTVAASPALAWRTVANGTFTTFEPETQYKVTFTLAAASGWSFSGLSSPNFSYAGASFVDVTIPTSGATAEVTITFPMVQWVDVNADSHGTDLVSKLNWLKTDGVPGRNYTITVNGTETIAPQTLSVATSSKLANTGITITGTGTIKLDSNGSLFAIRGFDNTKRITLVLAGNIKLQGKTGNNSPLVSVTECAALVIKDSVEITGNKVSGTSGGGVYVSSSSFTMSGGTISNNTVSGSSGGGVYVALPSSSFTMSGGTISNNEASGTGGGVYVLSATSFAMSGGTISDNEASGGGGGVYISSYVSSVTISGGIISDNTVSGSGGGIYVSSPSFTMSGGTISNNTASSGGGVYTSSSFTMSAGTISNNTASSGGGVNAFSVTMSAGTISGNTAASGGGVYSNSITKTGTAVIYGDTDSTHTPDTTENTATGGNGHAVLLSDGRKRNGDALAGQNLNSGQPGSAGGWEE